jgi:hypothetical protein
MTLRLITRNGQTLYDALDLDSLYSLVFLTGKVQPTSAEWDAIAPMLANESVLIVDERERGKDLAEARPERASQRTK